MSSKSKSHRQLFLGQASNYRATDVLKHTFAIGSRKCSDNLRRFLAEKYHTDSRNIILMDNGRSAIAKALETLLPKNSKVIINGFTCYAVLQAVKFAGMEPIYADINEKTLNFDVETLEKAIKGKKNVKALIIQNTLGITVNIKEIENFAKKHKLIIIEDLAHCAGFKYADGREVGSVGKAAALSFGKGKSLDTITGGALIFNSKTPVLPRKIMKHPKFSDTLRARWYPLLASIGRGFSKIHKEKYWYGPLIKMHFIERAVDAKLDYKHRPAHWQAKLALKQLKSIETNGTKPIRTHLFVKNRAKCIEELAKNGYNFREIWYDVPVSPVRYYKELNFPEKECKTATKVAKEIINLPNYYPLSELNDAMNIIERYQK